MSASIAHRLPFAPNPAPTPDTDAIRIQLDRIFDSTAFDGSTRNRAFLRYIVDETLAGRADRIKGYSIARDVFQRAPDFDGQLDPVVRLAATRLRRSLERYYLTAGRRDPLRIDLPKGCYIPSFEVRERDADFEAFRALCKADAPSPRTPFIIVRPFAPPIGTADEQAIAAGIAQELIGELVGDERLDVVAEARTGDDRHGAGGAPGIVLLVGTRRSGRRLRVTAQMVDHGNGRIRRVYTFDHTLRSKDTWTLEEAAARAIARAVRGGHGASVGHPTHPSDEDVLLVSASAGSAPRERVVDRAAITYAGADDRDTVRSK